ncbi:MAG: SDR family oxidoreductase [Myxococcota bacterium]|nr:SDR family oxidoreductase [Myxococcota bacterium]
MTTQRVLITGASHGFGLLTSKSLARNGHVVFATMRGVTDKNASAAKALARFSEDTPGKIHVLELDVLSSDTIDAAVQRAIELEGGIDVVINNAGIGAGGWAEGFSEDQFGKVFGVNLFGVHRVNRAVLPHLRERKTGLLLHISSILGRVVMPFTAPYTASKYALEGLVESYRYELADFGIDVAIVEPGAYGTNFGASMLPPGDQERVSTYGELADMPEKMWSGMMERLQSEGAPDPQDVADAIVGLVEMPQGQRPLRTIVDAMMGGAGADRINALTDEVQAELQKAMQG